MVVSAPGGWPSLTYERLPWQSSELLPRSSRHRPSPFYDAAVVPAIADLVVALEPDTVALVAEAAGEVVRFDAELGGEIAPFASLLLRTESAASSKIEHLTAGARAIAEAELGGRAGSNAALIVANERAMLAAIDAADRLDEAAILAMHEALLGESEPAIAGRWRTEQVWIGGRDDSPAGATFVPPHHSRVEAGIADLLRFTARDDVPVIAHAALSHAQLETIHPFADGNGRTGRALVHAHLRSKGLVREVTVPVSAGLLVDIETYFEALTAYRAGDIEPIVRSFAHAAFRSIGNGRHLVADLRQIRSGWDERLQARRGAAAWSIADLLVQQPVLNAATVGARLGIAPQNVYRSMEPLVTASIAITSTAHGRGTLWRSPEVLDALDRFAERAGRRRLAR